MKKIVTLFTLIIVCVLISSCENALLANNATSTPITTAISTTVLEIITNALPIYISGSIKLNKSLDDFDFKATKRYAYYNVPGSIEDLVPSGIVSTLFADSRNDVEPTEMPLVTLVKYCDILKEDFVRAIESDQENLREHNIPMDFEEYELPNADIIYTFDNEIIDYYYRRE